MAIWRSVSLWAIASVPCWCVFESSVVVHLCQGLVCPAQHQVDLSGVFLFN